MDGAEIEALMVELSEEGSLQDPRYYGNKKLSSRHMLMISMQATGSSNNEIAEHFQMTPSRVSVILNSPAAQAARHKLTADLVSNITTDVQERIASEAAASLDVLLSIRDDIGESGQVRSRVASNLLDRAGFAPVEKHANLSIKVSPETAAILKQSMEEVSLPPEDLEIIESTAKVLGIEEQIDW